MYIYIYNICFRKLVALNFSQFQYKNPNVQILCVKNLTPTPFITFFLGKYDMFLIFLYVGDPVKYSQFI